MTEPDLSAAASVIETASLLLDRTAKHLAQQGSIDEQQKVAYDLAHAASAVESSRALLDYGAKGDLEARITCAFVADAVHDLACKVLGRDAEWGLEPGSLDSALPFLTAYRATDFLISLGGQAGPRHLDSDFEMVQDTFRRFADQEIKPQAEHVHRHNADVPEEIISGLAEIGAFGLSVPEEYEGFASGGESDYMGMVVATEELSRGSLGIGGPRSPPPRDPPPGSSPGGRSASAARSSPARRS